LFESKQKQAEFIRQQKYLYLASAERPFLQSTKTSQTRFLVIRAVLLTSSSLLKTFSYF